MKRPCLYLLALLLLCGAARAADPVFGDVKALASTPLNAKVLKTTEKDGIVLEEVMYHAEMDGDKSVDIFGIYGYPKGGKNLPAFIWNQGGLYQASDYWVIYGAKRGFAVLCIDFPIPGYRSTGGYAVNSGLSLGDDPAKAPIAHGVVALLKGVTFLESRPEVDRTRLGMAGSSWGGFFTTLMVGIDARLKAGSCFFGTGSLQLGNNWVPYPAKDPAWTASWAKTLDPAWRLAAVKTPINWCTGTNDFAYWMPALMQTVATMAGPAHLALKPNWDHALTPNLDDEVFGFLDAQLNGKPAFPTLTPVKVALKGTGLRATWSFTAPAGRKITAAEVIVGYGAKDNWHSRPWVTVPATIQGTECTASLPLSAVPYWISGTIIDADDYRHSTPLHFVDQPVIRPLKTLGVLPKVDGCAEWGGFEKEQLDGYVALHGYPGVAVSADARTGGQAAKLKAGNNAFPPMHFIAGLKHRFTCYLKAGEATEVTVELAGQFDDVKRSEARTVGVGTQWAPVTFEFPTGDGVVTSLALTIANPRGKAVLLDDVSLVPVK